MKNKVKKIIFEYVTKNSNSIIAYHGTRAIFPFKNFDAFNIGSGIVNISKNKYNGFFFTTEKQNAEYYTEYFLCKVKIENVVETTEIKHPNQALNIAYQNKENYIVNDVLDGAILSGIIVVPKNNLDTIEILDWEFVGDEESIFESWDNFFNSEDDFGVTRSMIEDTLDIIKIDIEYLKKIPIFLNYYNSKSM